MVLRKLTFNSSVIPDEAYDPTALQRWTIFKRSQSQNNDQVPPLDAEEAQDNINNKAPNAQESSFENQPFTFRTFDTSLENVPQSAHSNQSSTPELSRSFEELLLAQMKIQPLEPNSAKKKRKIARGAELITSEKFFEKNKEAENEKNKTKEKKAKTKKRGKKSLKNKTNKTKKTSEVQTKKRKRS